MMKTLRKGLAIIELLSEKDEALSSKEISNILDINQSTVSRLLSVLVEAGYVYKGYNQNNELDLGVLQLSTNVLRKYKIINEAIPYIVQLLQEVGNQIFLGVIWRDKVMTLYNIYDAVHPVIKLNIEHGLPVHVSSIAKAILAFQNEDKVRRLLLDTIFKKFTKNTITSVETYLQELNLVIQRGYGFSLAEISTGNCFWYRT